jgi:hypothetical protein
LVGDKVKTPHLIGCSRSETFAPMHGGPSLPPRLVPQR